MKNIVVFLWLFVIVIVAFVSTFPETPTKETPTKVSFPKFYHATPLRYSHWRGLTKWQHRVAYYQDSVGYAHDTILFMDSIKKLIIQEKIFFK